MRRFFTFLFLMAANPLFAADRFEQRFENWTLIQDSSSALYCWIEATSDRFKLPEGHITERWNETYPNFQIALGPRGSVMGYGGHVGIPLKGGELLWLHANSNTRFIQANGGDEGLFWGRRDIADFISHLEQADTVFVLSDDVAEGTSPDLDANEYWVAFSLTGFPDAAAALLTRCGGDKGWNAPRSAG